MPCNSAGSRCIPRRRTSPADRAAPALFIPESSQETPVHEHIAPSVAIFSAVIPVRIPGIDLIGVLREVRRSCIGSLIIQRGIGRLLLIANLRRSDSDHGIRRAGVDRLRRDILPGVLIVIALTETGAFCLHGITLIGGPFVPGEHRVGSLPDAGSRPKRAQHGFISLQFLPKEIQLHLQVADRFSGVQSKLEQRLLPGPVRPLRKTVFRAEVKAILTAHGVKQLSDVKDPDEFAAIVAEAEGIGNG